MVERLFLAVPRGRLQFVIVVFPDHTPLLFLGWRSVTYQAWVTVTWVNVALTSGLSSKTNHKNGLSIVLKCVPDRLVPLDALSHDCDMSCC